MWSARTLWTLTLAAIAIYLFFAWDAVRTGVPLWLVLVGIPVIYFAVIVLFTVACFSVAWLFHTERPAEVRLDAYGCARLFGNELRSLLFSASRMMFYRWAAPESPPLRADLPVLLVHGVLCNAGVWGRLMRYLRKRNIDPLYLISYGPPLIGIDAFAQQLGERIDEVLDSTGARQVVLVTHSMGGLVARAYIEKEGGAKLRRVITLAAPNHGSALAWLFPGVCLAQMRPGNAWLAALNRRTTGNPPPLVSIWSWHDSMVAPQTSSRLAGAANIELIGIGHNALLGDPSVFALVAAELDRVAAAATVVSTPVAAAAVGTAA